MSDSDTRAKVAQLLMARAAGVGPVSSVMYKRGGTISFTTTLPNPPPTTERVDPRQPAGTLVVRGYDAANDLDVLCLHFWDCRPNVHLRTIPRRHIAQHGSSKVHIDWEALHAIAPELWERNPLLTFSPGDRVILYLPREEGGIPGSYLESFVDHEADGGTGYLTHRIVARDGQVWESWCCGPGP